MPTSSSRGCAANNFSSVRTSARLHLAIPSDEVRARGKSGIVYGITGSADTGPNAAWDLLLLDNFGLLGESCSAGSKKAETVCHATERVGILTLPNRLRGKR